MKNPGIAALLAFIIPGSGFIYCEKVGTGIVNFLIWLLLISGMFYSLFNAAQWSLFILIVAIIWWILGVFSSYNTAKKMNNKLNITH